MKRALIAILFLAPTLAWGKPKPADYTLVVHVQSSDLVTWCYEVLGHPFCETKQHLNVVIGGKKYELNGNDDDNGVLRTGNYKARMLTGDDSDIPEAPRAYEIYNTDGYEFLFPDGKSRKYSIVGESE